MVLAEAVVTGIAVGLICGGRFSALAGIKLRRIGLVYAALGLQVVAFPSGRLPWSTPDSAARILWLCSYALLLAFVVTNRSLRGIPVIAAGMACNLVAVLANGGLMPARPEAVRAAGLVYKLQNNSVTTGHAHLGWLVDRWAAPQWLPLANVYSVGDILIAAGTIATVVLAMRTRSEALIDGPEKRAVATQPSS
jgi:hypothetical protein